MIKQKLIEFMEELAKVVKERGTEIPLEINDDIKDIAKDLEEIASYPDDDIEFLKKVAE